MTLLIEKTDFTAANLVKFSQNILDDQLAPYIYAAQDYDLQPKLGEELYGALLALEPAPVTPEPTEEDPTPEPAVDPTPELRAFLNLKVKRFLVLASYKRFIAAHGMNVTQFGLTKTADPQGTFNQAEAQERAVILRQIDADANVALIRMTSVAWIFDGVTYAKDRKAGAPSASIRAPKRTKYVRVLGDLGYKNLL